MDTQGWLNQIPGALDRSISGKQQARVALPTRVANREQGLHRQVFDATGRAVALGPLLASGGEGSVYPLAGRPDVLVKLYHPARLAQSGGRLQAKIEAAIILRQRIPELSQLPLAWPQLAVFDSQGNWLGYAMRRAQGRPIRGFRNPALVRRDFPGLGRALLATALCDLIETVRVLHRHQICLGDINLDNFLLDMANGRFWLIDCDSFQLTLDNTRYPCPVGQESMIPPEHQGQDLASVRRTPESDTFSLTVLVFMVLMSGRHPFEHVGGSRVADNIRQGHFPYGQSIRPGSQGAVPLGPWYNWWSHLSYQLKTIFMQTFGVGVTQPAGRVPLSELATRLRQYGWSIHQGHLSDELWPAQAKVASTPHAK
ncbi:hypothetical protein ACK30K_16780 [Aeromonas caviae]